MAFVQSEFTDEEKLFKEKFEFFKQFKIQTNNEKMQVKKSMSTDENGKKPIKRPAENSQTCTSADIVQLMNSGELKSHKKETFKRSKLVGSKRIIETVSFDSIRETEDTPITVEQENPSISTEPQKVEKKRLGVVQNTAYISGNNLEYYDTKEVCERFGNIIKVYVTQDKKSAFVEFDNRESAEQAVKELNFTMINGSMIKTNFARPR
uniref:Negative elongation factor E n=1 Tax=Parastrongyloides trichosuri TaxID=131310 RepID=A0A0N4Z920_PARTI